jgi:hypothetical protein
VLQKIAEMVEPEQKKSQELLVVKKNPVQVYPIPPAIPEGSCPLLPAEAKHQQYLEVLPEISDRKI